MNGKQFIDTNILFYAYDSTDSVKQGIARSILSDAARVGDGHISTQVLGEFFHATVIRKKILSGDDAKRIIEALSVLNVAVIDLDVVRTAIAYHQRFQLRYWDALIVATAKQSACIELISEDFNDTQVYDGVRVRNPFKLSQTK
jgi:predicted nucleic acid-binding protein